MISPNHKAYLFIIEEICNKDTGIFNMDVTSGHFKLNIVL